MSISISDENIPYIEICRICFDKVKISNYPHVLKVCACNSYIHKTCLETQLSIKYQNKCEICNSIYIFNIYHNNSKEDILPLNNNQIPIEPNIQNNNLNNGNQQRINNTKINIIMFVFCISIIIFLFMGLMWYLSSSK